MPPSLPAAAPLSLPPHLRTAVCSYLCSTGTCSMHQQTKCPLCWAASPPSGGHAAMRAGRWLPAFLNRTAGHTCSTLHLSFTLCQRQEPLCLAGSGEAKGRVPQAHTPQPSRRSHRAPAGRPSSMAASVWTATGGLASAACRAAWRRPPKPRAGDRGRRDLTTLVLPVRPCRSRSHGRCSGRTAPQAAAADAAPLAAPALRRGRARARRHRRQH